MKVWCLYVSAGIFPFKLTFRYRESATKIKIWLQKEKMCNQILILRSFVNTVIFPPGFNDIYGGSYICI
ncbi:hypothetical protein C1192_07555 [Escherichia marmotae]|nr:hypothetical protein C1192_07555 [Escherichia marmotae]